MRYSAFSEKWTTGFPCENAAKQKPGVFFNSIELENALVRYGIGNQTRRSPGLRKSLFRGRNKKMAGKSPLSMMQPRPRLGRRRRRAEPAAVAVYSAAHAARARGRLDRAVVLTPPALPARPSRLDHSARPQSAASMLAAPRASADSRSASSPAATRPPPRSTAPAALRRERQGRHASPRRFFVRPCSTAKSPAR